MSIVRIKQEECIITYEDTPEKRDQVYKKLIDWMVERGAVSGEIICQSDICNLEAPNLLAEIADDIMKFEMNYDP